MFDSCGVQHLLCFGCLGWAWKRCIYTGADDSKGWPLAGAEEFRPVPRICRLILATYEDDLRKPECYGLNPDWLIKRTTYEQTGDRCPPYLIYLDHDHREIVVAIRGLNLTNENDYYILLNNRLGMQMLAGGYVHHGLLKAAVWLLNEETETLSKLWAESGSRYRLVFAGHSLGSGVAALITILVVNDRDGIGGIPRRLIAAYAVAPARCVSLNLAVKYADVINSIVLQDDFLPRTSTPLEDHFQVICCMPCFFFRIWIRDVFVPSRRLRDPRRLYAPGRMYHIVERKFFRIGRVPPIVKTACPIDGTCPIDGRFEYVVLSCNASSDHEIVWIEREAQKALDIMVNCKPTQPPVAQKFERDEELVKCHNEALERAESLGASKVGQPVQSRNELHAQNIGAEPAANIRTNWDEFIDRSQSKHAFH